MLFYGEIDTHNLYFIGGLKEMITGIWKELIEIVYDGTGSMILGVYLYALLTLTETIAISTIFMSIADRIKAKMNR